MSSENNSSPVKDTKDTNGVQKESPSKSLVDRLPHIDFAPLDVPLHRRLQTLSTMFVPFMLVISFLLVLALCFIPVLWPVAIAYFTFIYFDKTPERGGRRQNWFRNLKVFKYQADFFKTYIHRETKLDPSKNYIFGYHPHGFIGYGAQICFGTEAVNVSKIFTGLTIHPLTLSVNFKIPFHRELLMMMGCASVSKSSINYILNSGPGKSCLIVVGGAQESLHAAPDKAELVLENRMGFVKIAIQNGANLVPVYGFGENSLYNQIEVEEGSTFATIRRSIKKVFGFTLPLVMGRGLIQYTAGLVPYRVPLHIVVGKPIEVVKNPNPTKEEIQKVHAQYLSALKELYDTHKDKYHPSGKAPELKFVDN